MLATIIISLGLVASTPSTPETKVAPKQTAIVFKDQQAVYNIQQKKRRK